MSRRFGRQRKRKLKKAMEAELAQAKQSNDMAKGLYNTARLAREAWADVLAELQRELPNWSALPVVTQHVNQVIDRYYVAVQQRLEYAPFKGPEFPPMAELEIARRTLHVMRAGCTYDHLRNDYRIHLGLQDGDKRMYYAVSHNSIGQGALHHVAEMVSRALIEGYRREFP